MGHTSVRRLLVIGAIAPAIAAAALPLEFKGVPLGASREETFRQFDLPRATMCSSLETDREVCSAEMSYAGEPASVQLVFERDTLERVSLTFQASAFDAVIEAMTEKFGTPSRDEHSDVRTAMNLRYRQRRVEWTRPDGGMVFAWRHGTLVTRSAVVMTSANGLRAERAREAARRSGRKKDM